MSQTVNSLKEKISDFIQVGELGKMPKFITSTNVPRGKMFIVNPDDFSGGLNSLPPATTVTDKPFWGMSESGLVNVWEKAINRLWNLGIDYSKSMYYPGYKKLKKELARKTKKGRKISLDKRRMKAVRKILR